MNKNKYFILILRGLVSLLLLMQVEKTWIKVCKSCLKDISTIENIMQTVGLHLDHLLWLELRQFTPTLLDVTLWSMSSF